MISNELLGAPWRKSTYSNGQANCVEVAAKEGGGASVAVRDSKKLDGSRLIFPAETWRQFVKTSKLSLCGEAPLP